VEHIDRLLHNLKNLEKLDMADFAKLNADIADLSAKVDALLAKQTAAPLPAPPPVDEQPEVDAAAASVEAIAAKIPA